MKTTLRRFKPDDLEDLPRLQPSGWRDIRYFFRLYAGHRFCYPIVAIRGDKVVGVANATINGNVAWPAHIIVSETARRQGIGKQMTGHLIRYLKTRKCNTIQPSQDHTNFILNI